MLINIQYFFVKDRVDKGEIEVEYCPTYHMVADYFTKPLNGKLFRKFRDIIMGYKPMTILNDEAFAIKERVDKVIENVSKDKNKNIKVENKKGKQEKRVLTYAEIEKKGKEETNDRVKTTNDK